MKNEGYTELITYRLGNYHIQNIKAEFEKQCPCEEMKMIEHALVHFIPSVFEYLLGCQNK